MLYDERLDPVLATGSSLIANANSYQLEAPVGIEPTNSRFAVCRLTTWPRRRVSQVTPALCGVQARHLHLANLCRNEPPDPSAAAANSCDPFPMVFAMR